jgi:hypothetical protein
MIYINTGLRRPHLVASRREKLSTLPGTNRSEDQPKRNTRAKDLLLSSKTYDVQPFEEKLLRW